jgi:hypothetical protein
MPYKDPAKKREWDKTHRPEHGKAFFKSLEDRREIIAMEDEYYADKKLGSANLHASEISKILKRPIGKRRRQLLELATHQRISDEVSEEELQDAGQISLS